MQLAVLSKHKRTEVFSNAVGDKLRCRFSLQGSKQKSFMTIPTEEKVDRMAAKTADTVKEYDVSGIGF